MVSQQATTASYLKQLKRNEVTWLQGYKVYKVCSESIIESIQLSSVTMSHLFSLVGDSNVRRYLNKNSLRASPLLKSCQVLSCGHLESFASALGKVRSESTACIISCISNFISDAEGPTSLFHRIDPVLQDVKAALLDACAANPARRYLVAPPMYRTHPLWYREGLPEILTSFSLIMSHERPENLHLLPSFSTPEFDQGGVHLTPYSGLEFVLSLVDGAQELIDGLPTATEEVVSKNTESTRVLEDRVVALEQDHRRLNRVVDNQIAVEAEMSDFLKNERFEDSFVVEGTPKIPDEVTGKPWQEQATKDVQVVLKKLMGREMKILFVQNVTTRQADAVVAYSVKMLSVADSKAIRLKFGSFFLGGSDKRPTELKPYSIKNRITPETKIRISILKLMAKRYRDSNPGSK